MNNIIYYLQAKPASSSADQINELLTTVEFHKVK